MAQQTAVEILIQELKLNEIFTPEAWKILQPIVEKVKKIEKQQIIDAWNDDTSWNAKKYYKKTYEE